MKKTKFIIMILTIGLFIVGCNQDSEMLERTDFLMDTVAHINLYENGNKEGLDKAFSRLFEIENRMSRTLKNSDVSRINKEAGKSEVEVSDETWEMIRASKELAELTEGLFDPTIGPLSNLWEINASTEDRDWIPKEESIEKSLKKVDYKKIDVRDNFRIFLEEELMEIDLGAAAKGYAADEAKRVLLESGCTSAIIDLGGNLHAVGEKPSGEAWKIGVQDPRSDNQGYIGVIKLKDKSIVTSGDYERFFELDGVRYHHIIDPKTGYPSNNDLASATIISDSSFQGDVFSTASFIMGLEKGRNFIESQKGIEGIFITKDKKIYLTSGIKNDFELKDKSKEYELMDE